MLHVGEQKRAVQESAGGETEQKGLLLRQEHGTRLGRRVLHLSESRKRYVEAAEMLNDIRKITGSRQNSKTFEWNGRG